MFTHNFYDIVSSQQINVWPAPLICHGCMSMFVSVNDLPVHPMTLSTQFLFLFLPLLLLLNVVHYRMVVERMLALMTWTYHFKFIKKTIVFISYV